MEEYVLLDRDELIRRLLCRDEQIKQLEMRIEAINRRLFSERTRIAAIESKVEELQTANVRGFLPLEFEERLADVAGEVRASVNNWFVRY
jgi:FAD synthase